MLYEIKYLLFKEFHFEIRNRYALNGILLYLLSTFFLLFLIFQNNAVILKKEILYSLYWMVVIFTSVNAVSKSFVQESRARFYFYYTLIDPRSMILSKIIYNSVLIMVLSYLSFGFFSVFFNSFSENIPLMMTVIPLGSIGFASIFSLVSAIASKTNNNFSLMAILGFPLLLPLLLTLVKISRNDAAGFAHQNLVYLFLIFCISVLVILLSYILFAFLWKE
jgi:heme exporter protein B